MRRWWQVGIRNWRAKPVRTLLALTSIALGVAEVVWITCSYESVRRTVTDTVVEWIGRAQITIESVGGRWGLFAEGVDTGLDQLPNVAHLTRRTLETVLAQKTGPAGRPTDEDAAPTLRLDFVGIELPAELDFRSYRILPGGRMLRPDESDGVLVEDLLAREWDLHVGSLLRVWYPSAPDNHRELRIVGLVDRRRVSAHQLPMAWATIPVVQQVTNFPGKIKSIDVMLADDSAPAIRATAEAIRRVVRPRDKTLKVSTSEAQLKQLRSAQAQLEFVLMLISCVALLTAFFIILSTMAMGVAERITQLGLLRCVGMTRLQLFGLVLIEILPLAVVGVLAGVPCGLALQWATMKLVPQYVGSMALSGSGLVLAVGGGLGTAVLGTLGPAARAAAVTPIAASRMAPTPHGFVVELLAAAVGAFMLVGHQWITGRITSDTANYAWLALGGLLLLYGGYALIAPFVVIALGEPCVRGVSKLMGIRRQLVSDQVGRRPWRAGAVCCGLMVGLSLIVALQVHSESVKAGWQFPRQFPEAMIYSWQDVPRARMEEAARRPGVAAATIADDIRCKLVRKGSGFLDVLDPFYRFIAGDPETFPHLIKLVYLEGNEADALARLRQGGNILVTREFSQARRIHLNEDVTLRVGDVSATFKVAGVIASPALDIAVSFFNAGGEFQVYAVGSFIGTLADAHRLFGRDNARLLLFNLNSDLGGVDRPAPFTPFERLSARPAPSDSQTVIPQAAGHLRTAAEASGTEEEKKLVQAMIDTLGSSQCAFVTARQLKQSIDRNIDRVTLLLAAIPAVGLIVAALGVANLMMANVAARVRQIAVLRAVGMTRFQVIRLVAAEALILGLLGSGLGLTMGLHLGHSSNAFTHALWGFEPLFAVPWAMVLGGAGLAIGLCLLAAAVPARVASRRNIVAALQAT